MGRHPVEGDPVTGKSLGQHHSATVHGMMPGLQTNLLIRLGSWCGLVLVGISLWLGSATNAAIAAPVDSGQSSRFPGPASQLSANDVASEKVSQFVSAYLQIVTLIDQQENELQRVETESESLQLQRQIRAEAFVLIEQSGLSRQEYSQLLGLANRDPDFRDRILAQLEETTLPPPSD